VAQPDKLFDNTPSPPQVLFAPAAISQQGSSLPHQNMQPYQVLNYCIAWEGIFPSRN
jgi:microcystin-dependent protein